MAGHLQRCRRDDTAAIGLECCSSLDLQQLDVASYILLPLLADRPSETHALHFVELFFAYPHHLASQRRQSR